MQAACNDVRAGQSVWRVALTYDIPKSTFYDRMTGRVTGNKPGPPPFLSDRQEDELAPFLEGCASIGYARSKKQVIALVQRVTVLLEKGGGSHFYGQAWHLGFTHG